MRQKVNRRDWRRAQMMPVSEAIGESFRRTRLWHIWREVPDIQKIKILRRWANSLAFAVNRLNGSTPVRKAVEILAAEIEDDIKHRGGLERVWHDLKASEQQSLRRKWRGIFLKNLYPPETESPAKKEISNETKLDAPGNGNIEKTLSPDELAGTPASPAALEQTPALH